MKLIFLGLQDRWYATCVWCWVFSSRPGARSTERGDPGSKWNDSSRAFAMEKRNSTTSDREITDPTGDRGTPTIFTIFHDFSRFFTIYLTIFSDFCYYQDLSGSLRDSWIFSRFFTIYLTIFSDFCYYQDLSGSLRDSWIFSRHFWDFSGFFRIFRIYFTIFKWFIGIFLGFLLLPGSFRIFERNLIALLRDSRIFQDSCCYQDLSGSV